MFATIRFRSARTRLVSSGNNLLDGVRLILRAKDPLLLVLAARILAQGRQERVLGRNSRIKAAARRVGTEKVAVDQREARWSCTLLCGGAQ